MSGVLTDKQFEDESVQHLQKRDEPRFQFH